MPDEPPPHRPPHQPGPCGPPSYGLLSCGPPSYEPRPYGSPPQGPYPGPYAAPCSYAPAAPPAMPGVVRAARITIWAMTGPTLLVSPLVGLAGGRAPRAGPSART
ncbi:hypothetical protein ACFSL4_36445 [Streptomyces caeni]|uniref:Uncharacterized protein n=1 Tax=Streptomyces caeni TaxID=2307231 RepID=A0ABW4J4N1_9ACTN